jgi:F-type H+-transporting ATPase subunit b
MALQFILLTVALTFIFYKPVAKVLKERETFISTNLAQASEKLVKADELFNQYDEQIKLARTSAQSLIADAEKEAKEIVGLEISQARKDAAILLEQTDKEIQAQKTRALLQLEEQVDTLRDLIKEKLLGTAAL